MFNPAELRKVLEPFAALKPPERWGDLEGIHVNGCGWLLAGDLRAAAALYARLQQDEGVPEARPTPSGDGWNRDVDAAPKDGTLVDLWAVYSNSLGLADGRRYVDSRWHDGGWHDFGGNRLEWTSPPDDENESAERRVTAWRHLPSPPSGDSPEEIARVADEFAKRAEKATEGEWAVRRSLQKHDAAYDYAISADGSHVLAEAFGRTSDGGWPPSEANAAFIAFCGTHRAEILTALRQAQSAAEGEALWRGEISGATVTSHGLQVHCIGLSSIAVPGQFELRRVAPPLPDAMEGR